MRFVHVESRAFGCLSLSGCDVGQTVAQEPIFYYYGQVLIGGPFIAF